MAHDSTNAANAEIDGSDTAAVNQILINLTSPDRRRLRSPGVTSFREGRPDAAPAAQAAHLYAQGISPLTQ
jgi:hypothetical protein